MTAALHDGTLRRFCIHFNLPMEAPPEQLLRNITRAFANLPYENLTKIISKARAASPAAARRGPAEVVADHVGLGTGGTCFSLTATLIHLLRALGYQAEPILADRPYGTDTHCALVVWLNGRPHLVDPGFLIVEPLALDTDQPRQIVTSFNDLIFTPRAKGERLDLHTLSEGQKKHRITFKTSPVDWSQFLRVWDASFEWDMMGYPVLTRVDGGKQTYLQGLRLRRSGRGELDRREVAPAALPETIYREFGIDQRVVDEALAILRRGGQIDGDSSIT